MLETIASNLNRQSKALALLLQLMQEEFSLLTSREPKDVTRVEFSIQELMGQILVERKAVKGMLHNMRLVEFLETAAVKHPANAAKSTTIKALLQEIQELEQECARQAKKNSKLVLALMDQGEKLLHHLHEQIRPNKKDSYSKRGQYSSQRPQASLIRGRL